MTDFNQLPPDLPVPEDEGAADHLPGRRLPAPTQPATTGRSGALDQLGAGRTVLYMYPLTGRPDVDLPHGWGSTPGAQGCTTQACDFRDHHDALRSAGAARVFGLSSQDRNYQSEVVDRLHLPFAMLSDSALSLARGLGVPTSRVGDAELFTRLTLVVADATIEKVFYPVFPPNEHAQQGLAWMQAHPDTTR